MFPIRIKIAQRAFPSKRAYARASKTAHQEMGEYYHDKLIPKHFQPGAEQEYHYRRRKEPGYKTRKGDRPSIVERAIGAGKAIGEALTTPLVFSGSLRRLMLSLGVVRPYPSRVTIEHLLPVYAPSRPKTSRNPPLAEEATRISGRERGILARVLATAMDREQAREFAKENKTVTV